MRFLILTQYFPPETGGPPVRLGAMTRQLARSGHDVEVVTALPNYPTGEIFPEYRGRFRVTETWEGVTVHRTWCHASTGAGLSRLLNYFSFVATSASGLRRARRPDYLFVSSPPLFVGLAGIAASRAWDVPMIFNVADLWPDSARELGLLENEAILQVAENLESWIYRRSAYVSAVTGGIRSTLVSEKGVPEEKVLFLPNGVDTDLFRPREPDSEIERELGIEGEWVVLYAGTHGYAHGLDVALEAAAHLRDTNVRFVFIGGGSEKKRLVKRAGEMGLDNTMFLDPEQPSYIARLYGNADAGLSTLGDSPLFEGTRPAKIMAAMSAGTPVLYSGEGEGARMVERAKAGLVTPPQDGEALADAIRRLRDDPELASHLGRNGRSHAEEFLSWDVLVDEWVSDLLRRDDASDLGAQGRSVGS